MPERWDAIVTGLGAMGSAAVRELAHRGLRVLGLDRYAPPHAHGSTHGRSRIIREAYFEHPAYVPLVQRADELWTALAREVGEPLFVRTGGLMIGPEHGALVAGARESAVQHGLPYELLSSAEVRGRFPALAPDSDAVALYEPRAGVLFPEACVGALLSSAARAGAELRTGEAVRTWRAHDDGVRVVTADGEYIADRLVLTLGPWLPKFLGGADISLSVERQVQHWFSARERPHDFTSSRLPIALWEASGQMFYTIPDFGDGIKVAVHHQGELTDPDHVRRTVDEEEIETVRSLLERYLPNAAGEPRDHAVCLYTNTTDGHFLIDHHPLHPQVVIASACSGHGFKFATAIGEMIAKLSLEEGSENWGLFRYR